MKKVVIVGAGPAGLTAGYYLLQKSKDYEVIIIEKEATNLSEDDLMMLALDCGAEDFSGEDEYYEITTSPDDFSKVCEKLQENGLTFVEADIQMVPTTYVDLDEKSAEKMERLIERLDELDDVSEVFHNWNE